MECYSTISKNVFCEEFNAYNSFNVAIDFEDGKVSLCRIPHTITLYHMRIIIRSHLIGPFYPQLSHLWYHVPPEFVKEGIDEFLFVRNDEDLQHAIHWHSMMVPMAKISFYVNFMKVEKCDNFVCI